MAKSTQKKKKTPSDESPELVSKKARPITSTKTLILCIALLLYVVGYFAFGRSSASEHTPVAEPQHAPHGGMLNEHASLQVSDKAIAELMVRLNDDRFTDGAGRILRELEHVKGAQQFYVRCLLAFWHLHRNQLVEAQAKFDAVLIDGNAPSHMSYKSVKLWRSVMHRMQRQHQLPHGTEKLIEERDTLADLRRTLTLGESDRRYLWQELFETEGKWLLTQVPDHNSKDNSKCLYVPGLLAHEYHPTSHFPEAQALEARYGEIKKEVNVFLQQAQFGGVGGNTAKTDADLVTKGDWSDISLFSAGAKNVKACEQLPKLCALLEKDLPEVTKNVMGHALLSRIVPGTALKRHHGSSNCQLSMHLGLIVPKGAGIEVNRKHGRWKEGKVLVFDDSFYHSVWHNGSVEEGPRLVLLLRAYHPEWTLEERAGLIFHHNETPWTMEERMAEVADLSSPAAQARWNARKLVFQYGPSSDKVRRSHSKLSRDL